MSRVSQVSHPSRCPACRGLSHGTAPKECPVGQVRR
jgi:hypothetical protein